MVVIVQVVVMLPGGNAVPLIRDRMFSQHRLVTSGRGLSGYYLI